MRYLANNDLKGFLTEKPLAINRLALCFLCCGELMVLLGLKLDTRLESNLAVKCIEKES